ncbi:hypothetical protein PF005_g16613 [Phytophthora fragariae]|uniref:Uncharacterized protein n=1 Tax=Phytophthora fragariae TaxID=53985 RepID=A0A6A3K011_9STRA|nr:hypothetical protein PF009_g16750 [Phytophthora fragariae]KAE8997383.1 hypothetical protein PF011_g15508 [Phytophthora fragariae]KAE9096752.1 hypothetical protein PF007_g16873 [Phytophthora fragariae]KAE9096926.1 hypothetical protein PF010_g16152 [Phytophthora fragariae]KAE9130754.1 hypothetical protein PF006_g15686 [Phytophthora fragariae]
MLNKRERGGSGEAAPERVDHRYPHSSGRQCEMRRKARVKTQLLAVQCCRPAKYLLTSLFVQRMASECFHVGGSVHVNDSNKLSA